MKIKNRLALYFALITAVTLTIVLAIIYISFNSTIRTDFFNRLNDRAKITVQIYFKADELSSDSLGSIPKRFSRQLSGEIIRIYNDKNKPVYIKDKQPQWSDKIIEAVRQDKVLSFYE